LCSRSVEALTPDLGNFSTLPAQVADVSFFVQAPPLGERLQERIRANGASSLSVGDIEIQLRQMATIQKTNQVRSTQEDLSPDQLHASLSVAHLAATASQEDRLVREH
jgi:hypothetical protein